jgi:hypothetical protein
VCVHDVAIHVEPRLVVAHGDALRGRGEQDRGGGGGASKRHIDSQVIGAIKNKLSP